MLASAAAATLFMVVSSGVDGAGASGDVSVDGTRAVGEASRWAVGDDSPGFVLGRARGRGDGRDVGDETVVAAAINTGTCPGNLQAPSLYNCSIIQYTGIIIRYVHALIIVIPIFVPGIQLVYTPYEYDVLNMIVTVCVSLGYS